jgi:AraC-like DNA-binding protein
VFAVKFRPGGFFPFLRRPMAELTGRALSLRAAFGRGGPALARQVLALEDLGQQVALVEGFLREGLPAPDANVEVVGTFCRLAMDDRSVTRVEPLAERVGLTVRALQRLFRRYVGVSPKFVIRRYRLHDAAERLSDGRAVDWAALAQELGYFDQAHFSKDFKALVGQSPAEYAARCAAPAATAATVAVAARPARRRRA